MGLKITPEMIFQIYHLYSTGASHKEVAGRIGLAYEAYKRRRVNNPAVKAAYKYGKRYWLANRNKSEEFDDLVIGRLPPELKTIWDTIVAERRNPKGLQPIQHMEMRHKQVLWVHAWVKYRFNTRKACEFLQLPYRVVDFWRTQPQFKKLMDGLVEIKKDFIEDSLMGLVQQRNPLATVFAAKTQLRDRGYGEKHEIVGTVDHKHSHEVTLNISELDLPVNVMMMVMDAIEKKRKLDAAPKPLVLEHRSDNASV